MVHITRRPFDEHPVLLPPLAEQDRIVAAIEEEFSRLDAGVAALTAAEGKADLLVRASIQAALVGWEKVPLKQVLHSLRNGIFVSRPGSAQTPRGILRISSVRPRRLDISDVRFVPQSAALKNEEDFRVNEGDLLFIRYNGNPNLVGVSARVGREAAGLLYPDKLIRGVVNVEVANPEYLEIALNCEQTLHAISQKRKTTAGQVGIAGSELLGIPVPLPPREDQDRIVEQTNRLLNGVNRLRQTTGACRAYANSLRSSVLTAAFSGKLARQDEQDEPARLLLERVAAERHNSNGQRLTRSRSRRTKAASA